MTALSWEFEERAPGADAWLADIAQKVAAKRRELQDVYDRVPSRACECGRELTNVEAHLLPTVGTCEVRWGFHLEHTAWHCGREYRIDRPNWWLPVAPGAVQVKP